MASQDDTAIFKLPPVLDFGAAESFLETIRQRAQASPRLCLDAAEVETLTSPCAQIILAALDSQAEVTIAHPSQAFLDAFADMAIDVSAHCVAAHIDEAAPDSVEAVDAAPAEMSGLSEEISTQPKQPTEEVSMSKRILTIDDSKTIRDMLRLTLLEAGFEVHQAIDGQDGCDILDKQKFDVVITDINMPKMDGYGVIRHMRAAQAHKTTPILVLTTESEGPKRNLAREAGATGWMVKPFDPEQLVATINKVAP